MNYLPRCLVVRQARDVGQVGAALQRVHQFQQRHLPLPAHDEVAVVQCLVGQKGDVRAADDGRDAQVAHAPGHLVGRWRGCGGGGEAHQAGLRDVGPVNRGQRFDVDAHIVAALGQQPAQQRQAQAREERPVEYVQPWSLGFDQSDLHVTLLWEYTATAA